MILYKVVSDYGVFGDWRLFTHGICSTKELAEIAKVKIKEQIKKDLEVDIATCTSDELQDYYKASDFNDCDIIEVEIDDIKY